MRIRNRDRRKTGPAAGHSWYAIHHESHSSNPLQGSSILSIKGSPRNVNRRWHEIRKPGMKTNWSNNNLASPRNSISFLKGRCPYYRVACSHSTKYRSARAESGEQKQEGASSSRAIHMLPSLTYKYPNPAITYFHFGVVFVII